MLNDLANQEIVDDEKFPAPEAILQLRPRLRMMQQASAGCQATQTLDPDVRDESGDEEIVFMWVPDDMAEEEKRVLMRKSDKP